MTFSVLLIGQASSAYNKHGIHLKFISWRTASSQEDIYLFYRGCHLDKRHDVCSRWSDLGEIKHPDENNMPITVM